MDHDMTSALRIFSLISLLTIGSAVWAATPVFIVNSVADDVDATITDGLCKTATGTCTLRAAIMQANAEGSVGAMIMLPAGNYTIVAPKLGSDPDSVGDYDITNSVGKITIVGAGLASTKIDANGIDRAIHVHAQARLSLSGVTIVNADVLNNNDENGGGIENEGSLALTDAVIEGASAEFGGCIFNDGGSVVLKRVVLSHCVAHSSGGGLHSFSGYVSIDASTIDSNHTLMSVGGGISVYAGNLTATNSTFSSNAADQGGGLYLGGTAIVLVNDTIAGNHSYGRGGGFMCNCSASMYNVTVSRNYALNEDGDGYGSGFFSTSSATLNIFNSVFATNYQGPFFQDCEGPVTLSYENRIFLSQCPLTLGPSEHHLELTDGTLGLLQNNGGPTQTMALASGSNAIDAANANAGCLGPDGKAIARDQRGFPRNVGRCDLGAYEFGATADEIFISNFEAI